jgi:4-hydroxybutyryl-CoA dehydratase/vinylacetyl-CoA-Delta-isomerase
MKREIFRNYPIEDRVSLVRRLLERGVLAGPDDRPARDRQPGRCCPVGCEEPEHHRPVNLPSIGSRG